jgi:hypothetical protein
MTNALASSAGTGYQSNIVVGSRKDRKEGGLKVFIFGQARLKMFRTTK